MPRTNSNRRTPAQIAENEALYQVMMAARDDPSLDAIILTARIQRLSWLAIAEKLALIYK